jgi:hypothetical protein
MEGNRRSINKNSLLGLHSFDRLAHSHVARRQQVSLRDAKVSEVLRIEDF